MLRSLENVHRRRVLLSILEHNPQDDRIRVPNDVQTRQTESDRFRLELFHNHLPELEKSGYIEWNRDTHEIVKGPKFDEIRPLLELIHAHRDELPDGWL